MARCASVFRDPSSFWAATRLMSIAIGVFFSVLLARAAASHGVFYSLAVGLAYFCYEPAWDYSIRLLGNESFALPLSLATAWLAAKSLGSAHHNYAPAWWAGWGAMCALCWLNKLNYIAWTAAAFPACLIYLAANRPTPREAGVRFILYVAGFLVSAQSATALMLGKKGFENIVSLHVGVLTHSGAYGGGPEGAVSASAVREAVHALSAYWQFLALAGIICTLALWFVCFDWIKHKTPKSNSAYLVYLVSTAALFLAATLKHYGAHYLIPGVPAISLLILAIGSRIGFKGRIAIILAVAMTLILSYRRYSVIQEANFIRETEFISEVRAVEKLPGRLEAGALWTYRLPHKKFVMEAIEFLAGVPEVATVLDQEFTTPDLAYFLWIPEVRTGGGTVRFDAAKWRYAVFGREYFEYFLTGPQSIAKDYFEQRCRRVIHGPLVIVFERNTEDQLSR